VDPSSALGGLSRRRYLILVLILGGVGTTGPFATDMYLPALPGMSADLHASDQAVALTVTTFLIGLALGHLLAGPISDSWGRKRPLLIGLGVFTVTALVGALTPSVEVLIAVRFVQGLAGAAGMVIANAVVTDYARGRQAARLLSRLAIVAGLAPIVAPLIGGALLQVMAWRGLFVVITGIGAALTVAVALGLPESLPRERRSAAGLRPIFKAMTTLSRDFGFMGYTLTGSLAFVAFFTYLAGSSFVYQDIYGVSPTVFSLLFAVNAVGMLGGNELNHRLLARYSPRQLLGAGLAVDAVAGVAILIVLALGGLSVWALAVPLFVLVTSLGLVFPDSTALALSLHPDVAGSASAYFGTVRLGLGALATALVGVGGTVTGVPMGLLIAVSSLAALPLFAVVVRRTRDEEVLLDTPEEASVDMPVG
jgi:DHA1 family bicyclomycin/chloramphenicol resistance-like MFS transporter